MTDPFEQHRRLLFRVAYDILGSVADAEDVVQEAWLRWDAVAGDTVRDPRAYLVRIATTQALNRVRANVSRREDYVGPWLPEPLVEPAADPAEEVATRAGREDDVSLAMLVVLETLSPAERAVFVLREVFGMTHDEVAAALDRTPAAVRQLAHRAREHVQARRPRFETDPRAQRAATERFLAACANGDMAGLLDLLAPDVTLTSDGGGKVKSALRPITGREKVARFLLGIAEGALAYDLRLALVNGGVGLVGYEDDEPRHVALVDLDDDGRIRDLWFIGNPDKLAHLARR